MNNEPLNPTAPVGEELSLFRFWCQKTLPAVFDDSVSYYELLTKVVAKLNEVISNINTQSDAIAELQKLFRRQ